MNRALFALTVALTFCLIAKHFAVMAEKHSQSSAQSEPKHVAWGGDHIESGLPDYVSGDECLFCHRELGATWPSNSHQLTMRRADKTDVAFESLRARSETLAANVEFLLGNKQTVRFLKRSKQYGRVELHSLGYDAVTSMILGEQSEWDQNKFANRCAGCHATAVDTAKRAFSSTSIDCFACHGVVDLGHSKYTKLVLLSAQNRDPKQVVSICGQCHLRGGKSRSSQLPYPNTFVAGDNLFRDFEVDLSHQGIQKLPATERHIFENVRDVELQGDTQVTCLSCHSVHEQSTVKHQELDHSDRCTTCHTAGAEHSELLPTYEAARKSARSEVCEYPMKEH